MSIEETTAGTWRIRWRDHEGRQRTATRRRKSDAIAFERQTLADLSRGIYVDGRAGNITVTKWADDWLRGAMNLKAGGRDTYRRDLDRYILPALGTVKLSKLDAGKIDAFLSDELDRLAPSSVHRHYRTIRRMLQVAVDRGKIPANPCGKVTPPTLGDSEMRFLTVAEVDGLAAKISPRYRAWVEVAAFGGLRWSESVGLRRGRVDGVRVTVLEQLVRRADREWYREPPKSKAGRRTVTLPASSAAVLADHLTKWAAPGADGLVFPNQNGGPMNGPSFTGNVWRPALKRAGLDPKVRIHDLRHTAVALAIAAGGHPKAIQARLGHASIAVTLDRYGHLFPEMDADLALGLEGLRVTSSSPLRA